MPEIPKPEQSKNNENNISPEQQATIELAQLFFEFACRDKAFAKRKTSQMELSVTEAVTEMIKGEKREIGESVDVTYRFRAQQFRTSSKKWAEAYTLSIETEQEAKLPAYTPEALHEPFIPYPELTQQRKLVFALNTMSMSLYFCESNEFVDGDDEVVLGDTSESYDHDVLFYLPRDEDYDEYQDEYDDEDMVEEPDEDENQSDLIQRISAAAENRLLHESIIITDPDEALADWEAAEALREVISTPDKLREIALASATFKRMQKILRQYS